MIASNGPPRAGFTLLEMILALSIGLVLMISLYSVLSLQVQQAQSGRIILQEATLARSILSTMASDIRATLGAVPPTPTAPANSGASSPTATTSTSTTPSTSSSTSSSTPSTSMSTTTTGTSPTTSTNPPFNIGVYGTNNVLILTVSKVPRELNLTGVLGNAALGDPTQQATVSDLRRISYWISTGPAGLARQEVKQATSTDLTSIPPDVSQDSYKILASEVKDIVFQYFDGVNWQDSWDGTTLGGPTGDIPIGPPSAIAITLTLTRRAADNTDLPDDSQPKYRYEVAIPAGNNFPQTNP